MKQSFYKFDRHNNQDKQIEAVKKIFLPIGHIVLQWSYVDSNLELCLKIISKYYDTKDIINNKSKSKLTRRKILLLIKCFKELPLLVNFKNQGLTLMESAIDISNIRNVIIHGTYAGFNNDKELYYFNKLVYNKKTKEYFIEQYPYTLYSLAHLGKTILNLATDIAHLGIQLHPNKDML